MTFDVELQYSAVSSAVVDQLAEVIDIGNPEREQVARTAH